MNIKRFFCGFIFFIIFASSILSAESFTFSSTDLNGKAVTNDIFKNADVTVVNVWGTFCGPCIREMPDLAKWHSEMPKNVQIIGIVCDVNSASDKDGIADAKTIVKKTGVKFTNIIANESTMKVLQSVQYVPTTFLVDKNGNIVSGWIIGAQVKEYKKAVEDYLAKK